MFDPRLGGKKAIYREAGVEVGRQFAMAGVVVVETRVGWVKAGKPAGWEEEVDGVKQACWCGEMWDDNHEDGNHDEVWVKEAEGGCGLGKRVAEAGVATQTKKTKKAKMTKKAKTAKAKAAKAARAARAAAAKAVESDSELEEGWQKGWYGPVPSEE